MILTFEPEPLAPSMFRLNWSETNRALNPAPLISAKALQAGPQVITSPQLTAHEVDGDIVLWV